MLKHTISELKEAWLCIKAGRVTVKYPAEPAMAPAGYRGQPTLDFELCTGCSACTNACPSRTIYLDEDETHRLVHFDLSRCVYCGRCEEVCPESAVHLSPEFELSTSDKEDLQIRARFRLQRCRDCGDVIGTERQIAKLKEELGEGMDHLDTHMELCVPCRRKAAHRATGLGRRVGR